MNEAEEKESKKLWPAALLPAIHFRSPTPSSTCAHHPSLLHTCGIIHVPVLHDGAPQQGIQLVVFHVDGQAAAVLVAQRGNGANGLQHT
eukprot:1147666-Pelagomonas_calceolata.AAC.7